MENELYKIESIAIINCDIWNVLVTMWICSLTHSTINNFLIQGNTNVSNKHKRSELQNVSYALNLVLTGVKCLRTCVDLSLNFCIVLYIFRKYTSESSHHYSTKYMYNSHLIESTKKLFAQVGSGERISTQDLFMLHQAYTLPCYPNFL